MSKAAAIVAGIVLASGTAGAQQQERPTEEFDRSIETREDREDRTGETSERQGESASRPGIPEPYDTEAEERPLPLEETFDPRTRRPADQTDDSYGADVGQQQTPEGTAPASSASLPGRTVVTSAGEEVGTIEQVGFSREHDERVATINVGGFLGVGDRIIAIPLSELGLGTGGDVTTSMTRATIERQQEFDPSQLVTAEQQR